MVYSYETGGDLLLVGATNIVKLNANPMQIITRSLTSVNGFLVDVMDMQALYVSGQNDAEGVLVYHNYCGSTSSCASASYAYVLQFNQNWAQTASDTPVNSNISICQSFPQISVTDDNYVYIAYNQYPCSAGLNPTTTTAVVQYWSTTLSAQSKSSSHLVSSSSSQSLASRSEHHSSVSREEHHSSASISEILPNHASSSSATASLDVSSTRDLPKGGKGLATGGVVGIAVGAAGAAMLGTAAVGLGFWCRNRKKKKVQYQSEVALTAVPISPPNKRISIPSIGFDGKQGIKYTELSLGNVLGKGAFGIVYKGKYQGAAVAIKELPGNCLELPEFLESFNDEVSLMTQLRHTNIVSFYGVCKESDKYLIVMECMQGGSLDHYLRNSSPPPLQILDSITKDIVNGMVYLHGKKVIHRDLKPANVLLTASSGNMITAKISDFGTSRVKVEQEEISKKMTKGIGTPVYMAPEVMEGGKYTERADVYSFGIILWEMFTREEPYGDCKSSFSVGAAVIKGERPIIPEGSSTFFRELTQRCWSQEADSRPTMQEVQTKLGELEERKEMLFSLAITKF